MAFLETDVAEELYVELPDGYRDSPNQVGRLQKFMYVLMHAGLLCLMFFFVYCLLSRRGC